MLLLALLLPALYVYDLEVLHVVDRVSAERKASAVGLLDFQEEVFIFLAESLKVGRMEKYSQGDFFVLTVAGAYVANDTDQAALHLDTHGA